MTTEEFLKICGVRVKFVNQQHEDGSISPLDYVSWEELEKHPLFHEIDKWLSGQTTSMFGPWPWDVASFFRQKLQGIETPVCSD